VTEEQEHQSRPGDAHDVLWAYEKALAYGIKDFVAELCLADASIIIAYICNNHHANIDDLVASSAELHFKDGTLCYGHSADVSFEWGKAPAVVLDMEFVHRSVTVFFKLVLHGFYVGIDVQRVLLSDKSGDPNLDLQNFERALSDARLSSSRTNAGP
jgi:hypothetical protein